MHQPATGVELLLAGRENKLTTAVATLECLIGGQTRTSLPAEPPSRATAMIAPVTMLSGHHNRLGKVRCGGERKDIVPNQEADLYTLAPPRAFDGPRVFPVHTNLQSPVHHRERVYHAKSGYTSPTVACWQWLLARRWWTPSAWWSTMRLCPGEAKGYA